MHQELIEELTQFTLDNKLLFNYWFDEKRNDYYFTFQDQEKTWGYRRVVSADQLDCSQVPAAYLANNIITTLKEKIPGLY